eukprot:CAMPEP_0119327518 /NCGR_PEP_ID=MMETSP1333-20130426/70969_1 /TAXON_ID=418940 /ORGANISM="Scyphosphaera apsteinii, Strain RCC1455" /LENGTH=109 /DNA_ID=CAMNT_0007336129 /DNA_START=21 /DNA_END=347 /DNA_ORIENTATION=+
MTGRTGTHATAQDQLYRPLSSCTNIVGGLESRSFPPQSCQKGMPLIRTSRMENEEVVAKLKVLTPALEKDFAVACKDLNNKERRLRSKSYGGGSRQRSSSTCISFKFVW